MNISPLTLKELRGRMRGPRAFSLLTVYLGIVSGVALVMYLGASLAFDDIGGSRALGQPLYWMIVGMQILLVSFGAPAFTVAAITGERERGTLDLLRATLLRPVEIVSGKLLAALGYVLLFVACNLPLFGLAFTLGGVEPFQMVLATWCMVVSAISFSTLGLLVSARVHSTVNAAVITYGVVLVIVIGAPVIVLIAASQLLPSVASTSSTNVGAVLSALLVYGACISPVGVFTGTEANYLSSGRIWTMALPGSTLAFPAPFISFTLIHLSVAALLFWLAVRTLSRPDKL